MWEGGQLIILKRRLEEKCRESDRVSDRERGRVTYPGPELHHLSLDEAVFVLSLQ